jgi:hypothetical protein
MIDEDKFELKPDKAHTNGFIINTAQLRYFFFKICNYVLKSCNSAKNFFANLETICKKWKVFSVRGFGPERLGRFLVSSQSFVKRIMKNQNDFDHDKIRALFAQLIRHARNDHSSCEYPDRCRSKEPIFDFTRGKSSNN